MTRGRSRAFMLMEMLVVLLLILVGSGLITVGLASIVKSHKRIADFSNRYALVNDFLDTLRADVREGTAVEWVEGDDDAAPRALRITGGPKTVLYRTLADSVERSGADDGVNKRWDMTHTDVAIQIESGSAGVDLVQVTVQWHKKDRYDPQPSRRFRAVARCVGETSHARD